MYTPKVFEQNDIQAMHQCMQANPFATLVAYGENGLNAEHLPFLILPVSSDTEDTILRGHIAKANPLWQNVASGDSVISIFQSENAYISPNWYPSKKEDERVVPTWNYRAIHATGTIQFIHEPQWLLSLLNDLTNTHERSANGEKAWKVSDAPESYIESS